MIPKKPTNIPLLPNISCGVITRHTSSQTLRQLFRANGVCFGDLFVDNSFWLSRGVACYCVSVVSYLVKVQTREQCHENKIIQSSLIRRQRVYQLKYTNQFSVGYI
ncbi:Hypothetical_protein [Hexamita inflata]|uniref:Hypothetical_protein n=1 Tax=Hexamita inflata TaxID=28002 RepID=A0AA86UVM3_9EUKA|nr:Hypothetical protein HINF_LOCUS54272 [Hexamita inflata]